MTKKILSCCAALMMLFSLAQARAQALSIQDVTMQMGHNSVAYPQLSGLSDENVQKKINDDVVLSSGMTNHMVTLATLAAGQQKLTVTYEASVVEERVFSVVISAKGKLPGVRDGHAYTALCYDLTTGERLALEDLFTDAASAVERMETIAQATLPEELNGYMEYTDVVPLPQNSFTLDENGITFWYPAEQFSLLSGYSGACQFWYSELDGLWRGEEQPMTDALRRAAIEEAASSGQLPHVPAVMGESMQALAERYRLLRTPDEFPGGRYFVMEDPRFRQILVISDALQQGYDASVVEGVQLRRGGLYGLNIGTTVRTEWRSLLGEPDETLSFTESMAYDYGLKTGQCDVYHYGENELRLHADEQGVLCAIQLCK